MIFLDSDLPHILSFYKALLNGTVGMYFLWKFLQHDKHVELSFAQYPIDYMDTLITELQLNYKIGKVKFQGFEVIKTINTYRMLYISS